MTREDAGLLFRRACYCRLRGRAAITTNNSVKEWPGILAGFPYGVPYTMAGRILTVEAAGTHIPSCDA